MPASPRRLRHHLTSAFNHEGCRRPSAGDSVGAEADDNPRLDPRTDAEVDLAAAESPEDAQHRRGLVPGEQAGEDGVVRFDAATLGARQELHIVAVDDLNAVLADAGLDVVADVDGAGVRLRGNEWGVAGNFELNTDVLGIGTWDAQAGTPSPPWPHYLLAFEVAGVILLVAIIAAVALTLRKRPGSHRQNPSLQVRVRKDERVRLVKMKPESRQDG